MINLRRCLLVAERIIIRILKSHCKPHISVMALSLEAVKEFVDNSQSMKVVREEAISSLNKIDRISKPILYEEFFRKYLVRNVPCILTDWATDGWLSRADWCHDGKISWDLLERMFGHAVAPVSNCNEQQSYSQAKTSMTVKDFVAYIRVRADSRCHGEESPVLYLKDWHFTRDFPNYDAYVSPPYFVSDWLNEFWKNRTEIGDEEDDYRFVYIGPKDSWTPFHADVFQSYSWSANVHGRKRWILLAPGYEQQLQDKFGRLPFDLRKCDVDRNPNSMEKCFEVIQESGEVLFVPSGWYHQVYNLEDTISINHNWINGCNIDICWSYTKQRLHDVEVEIAQHRQMENWNKHCQLILRADSGMDYTDFYNLLLTVASKRLKQLCDLNSEGRHLVTQNVLPSSVEHDKVAGGKCSDVNSIGHVLYDLLQIQFLLENELTSECCLSMDADRIACSPNELISRIKSGIAKLMN